MKKTTVVNMHDEKAVAKAKADGLFVYVGRDRFTLGVWGNRYSHLSSPTRRELVKVGTREEAVMNHRIEVV